MSLEQEPEIKINGTDVRIAGDVVGHDKVVNIYSSPLSAVSTADQQIEDLIADGKALLAEDVCSVASLETFRTKATAFLQRTTAFGTSDLLPIEKPRAGSNFCAWAEYEKGRVSRLRDALVARKG